ncbi:MAG: family 43 glycosylhydrolase [Bacteroidales bacterium]|nr:family 43 glycosylhydrolase [Bacteroidales bacterium]
MIPTLYKMKQAFRLLMILTIFAMLGSCTDIDGDGTDTDIWEGSDLPEATSYRNPVWEPDMSRPAVIRGATQFYAFGDEKEWSPGLSYTVPVLRSTNLMEWTITGEAFETSPEWAEGSITSVSGIFSKTLGTYYMAFTIGDDGIGISSSKAPQGPYYDYGKLIDKDAGGFDFVREPFLIQTGLSFYLFFETDQGIYGTELTIGRNVAPVLKGDLFKIAGTNFDAVYVFRKESDDYYIFGTVGDESQSKIYMGRSIDIKGPYLDQDGNDLTESQGTLLLEEDAQNGFEAPGHVGGIFTDKYDNDWIMYHAVDIDKPELSSGADRRPLMLSPIVWDENGWPAEVIKAKGGWNSPKFEF